MRVRGPYAALANSYQGREQMNPAWDEDPNREVYMELAGLIKGENK